MNEARKVGPTIGCLMIEDYSSGGGRLSGLCTYLESCGVLCGVFAWDGKRDLYSELQNAYYRIRSRCGTACIAAAGEGAFMALALSAQLPVDRIVLIEDNDGAADVSKGMRRGMRRIKRYARRNMAFCGGDALVITGTDSNADVRMRRIGRELGIRRHMRRTYCVAVNKKVCTNREPFPENGIYHFLNTGELPKSLAETAEMCIIYE